jgi:hypothetical protein
MHGWMDEWMDELMDGWMTQASVMFPQVELFMKAGEGACYKAKPGELTEPVKRSVPGYTPVTVRWPVVPLKVRHWALGTGHSWTLGIGHWALGIGHFWTLGTGY